MSDRDDNDRGDAAITLPDRLLEQLSDGAAIDWERALAAHPDDAARIHRLRQIAAIRQQFREQRISGDDSEGHRELLFRWGHLQVVEALGEGGFGRVYRAYDELLDRDVALKLRRGSKATLSATRAFIDEARRLARVRHRNVLAVHGASNHDGKVGLWADLLDGETLAEWLRRDRDSTCVAPELTPERAMAIAADVLRGLEAIHAAGLTHGDVKASNLMIELDGNAVLMDFGAGLDLRRGDTDLAAVHGSPLAMAPELLNGSTASAKADIYSTGVLLYHALSGRYPFEGADIAALRSTQRDRLTPLRSLRRDLPTAFCALIGEMLARDPSGRPDAGCALDRLGWIARAPQRRRRRLALATVIGSLGLGLAVSLFALYRVNAERERAESAFQHAERERAMATTVKNFLVEGVQKAAPMRQRGEASIGAMLAFMAGILDERLSAYPDALADMRVIIGRGLFDYGESARGLALTERGVADYARLPETTAVTEAAALQLLALMYRQQDRPEDAERVARQALARAGRDDLGADITPLVYSVRGILANVLSDRGRFLESAEETQRLLTAKRETYGADSMRLASEYNNLGVVFGKLQRWQDSLDAYAEAGRLLDRDGAGDSVRRALIRHGRGFALMGLGRLNEAEALLRSARDRFRREYPENHALIRSVDAALAELRLRRGDPAGATADFEALMVRSGEQASPHLRLRYSRALLASRRWRDAAEQAQRARAAADDEYRAYFAYMDALPLWCEYRLGKRESAPLDESRLALQGLDDGGLGHGYEATLLRDWIAAESSQDTYSR
ncbi:MAG: serine/threonine protein kinase [Xanthomonadales bacterium]|nr:serine/threonine protein kinase [Xanthomonadales bacterium]